ncbi:hypothetical protein AAFA46_02380 [Oscillospiraceae bacterium WX1]
MLFNRHIAPSCSHCRYGSIISDGEVACVKRGITPAHGACRRYIYDPLKREPERPQFLHKKKPGEMPGADAFEI